MLPSVAKGDQNQSKAPKLKIIDETEEVVRLEEGGTSPSTPSSEQAPKRSSLRRLEDRPAAGLELGSADSGDRVAKQAPTEDLRTDEVTGSISIPPAFLIIVAIAFLFLLGMGVFLVMGGGKKGDNQETLSLQQQVQANRKKVQEEQVIAKEILAEITRVLEGYSSATTVEEMAQFVRQPERVKPLMERYYRNKALVPESGMTLVNQFALPLDTRSFAVYNTIFDNGSKKMFLAEVDNEFGVSIDWESDVCYQEMPVEEVLAQRPTESFDMRVFASPDLFYVYEFADAEKYQCLKLTFRDSDEHLFGYAVRGSPVEEELLAHFSKTRSKIEPMILKLRYPEGGKGERSVMIESFICPRWAYIENPDDE